MHSEVRPYISVDVSGSSWTGFAISSNSNTNIRDPYPEDAESGAQPPLPRFIYMPSWRQPFHDLFLENRETFSFNYFQRYDVQLSSTWRTLIDIGMQSRYNSGRWSATYSCVGSCTSSRMAFKKNTNFKLFVFRVSFLRKFNSGWPSQLCLQN